MAPLRSAEKFSFRQCSAQAPHKPFETDSNPATGGVLLAAKQAREGGLQPPQPNNFLYLRSLARSAVEAPEAHKKARDCFRVAGFNGCAQFSVRQKSVTQLALRRVMKPSKPRPASNIA